MRDKIALVFLYYLRFLAQLQLKKSSPLIIGITGTAGKTSTRLAIYHLLKNKFNVKMSSNANSETGIPLNILGIKPNDYSLLDWSRIAFLAIWKLVVNWQKYQIYIVEMGIDDPKPPRNMSYLLSIIQPKISIFLNVQPMHSQGFDKIIKVSKNSHRRQAIIDAIAEEKGKLITSLPQNGIAILNQDDPAVSQFITKTSAKVITFGNPGPSRPSVTLLKTEQSLSGTKFWFSHTNSNKSEVSTLDLPKYLLADHYGTTFAATLATGLCLGIDLKTGCQSLASNFQLPRGRSSLISGFNQSLIIDSSYNSSLGPLIDLLNLMKEVKPNRTLALLGDIRELGKVAEIEHQAVAKRASQICNIIILVGPQMKKYALPIIENKFKNKKEHLYQWFPNAILAGKFIKKILHPGDLILVKGSQNMIFLEGAIEIIMKQPQQAHQLLCRRGDFWNKKRLIAYQNL